MDTVTVSGLIADVRAKTDTVNDNNIVDADIILFLNHGYKKLYNEIVTAYQAHFDKEGTPFNLVSGTYLYTLPTDFLILKSVDLIRNNERFTLKPCSIQERNQWERRIAAFDRRFAPYRYFLQGNSIRFVPVPDSTEQILLTYIPTPTAITSSGQSVDVLSGFDEYITCAASVNVLARQERDVQVMMADREDAKRQVMEICKPRDAGQPRSVVDVLDDRPRGYGWNYL